MESLRRHLLITGRTGSWKSVFLKSLFYTQQYQSHKKEQYGLILLDPHGDLAEEILKFRLNQLKPERIVYIDPHWEKGKIPCINPFRQRVSDPILIDLMSQQFAKTFSELISEAGLSLQMETILKPCLSVLLEQGACGLQDLQVFMDDTQNYKRVELWKQSSFSVYRQFFETAFLKKKYAPTKLAIYTRLQHLQNNYSFYHMMNGKSQFNLKSLMKQWKVIIFNLSKGKLGNDTSKVLGRFISATLVSIALQRAYEPEYTRKPTYVFVDEFHNFASESMETVFSEMRKFKLHFIVWTQSVNQLPVSLKETVLNNTAVKLVGINGISALKAQAGDLGVPVQQLQSLFPFWFYLKHDHYPAKRMRSPNFLIKKFKKYSMNYRELQEMKKIMLDYSELYRTISSDSYQTKQTNDKENVTDDFLAKNLVSDENNASKSPNWYQNKRLSTNNCKPEFKL